MFGLSKAERIKRDNPLEQVIRAYGVELMPRGEHLIGRCPFHDDKNPSLSVTPSKGLWQCFAGCGAGSVIDWVALAESITPQQAIQRLASDNGRLQPRTLERPASAPTPRTVEASAEATTSREALLKQVAAHYHKTFLEHKEAQAYLKRRGIDSTDLIKWFCIGFADGSLLNVIPSWGETVDQLQALGILHKTAARHREHFQGCITVPIPEPQSGAIVGMYGRAIAAKPSSRPHLYLKGEHKGVINHEAAQVYDELILTEAILDALALYQNGLRNVIPCYGTNGLTPIHLNLLAAHAVRKVHLAFDNDEAGDKAAKKAAQKLSPLGIECFRVHLPEGIKDVNDYFLYNTALEFKGTKESFEKLLESAARTGFKRPRKSSQGLVSQSENDAHFMLGDVLYQVRGLQLVSSTSMRLVVTAEVETGAHMDRIDLCSAKSRASFCGALAKRLSLQPAKVEEDLLAIAASLEKLLEDRQAATLAAEQPKHYEMTGDERREALGLLKDPRLLDRIPTDLDALGFVGEEVPKKLCYLVATSRKTDKPLSAIIRSSSGAGKSALMERIAELMPPEEVEFFSRLTPMSLFYMDRHQLSHKLLIIDERTGSQDADYSIRNLQSRRRLTLAVVIRDPSSGKQRTAVFEVYGPTAIMESTTDAMLNPENANRNFEVYLDETASQTRKIHLAQRKGFRLEGWRNDAGRERLLRTHRNAQRLLDPLRVELPFVDQIDFPAQWVRTRRDQERFLCLISMIAFLHQHQREVINRDGFRYLQATADDYERAYGLARTVLAHGLSDLTKPARDLYALLDQMVAAQAPKAGVAPEDYTFSRLAIRESTGWPDSTLRRALKELQQMEYLLTASGSQGRRYTYRLNLHAQPESDLLRGLTTPSQLRERIDPKQLRQTSPTPWRSGSDHDSKGVASLRHFASKT